ncbi:MAG: hypothetical protein MR432_04580 [Prevotellaceae bacterium]|nr:hypothetical protein [Prevotellaceae bacterium]MDD7377502.1 hypothetical protein [Prevotellaceae bacterium]MDY4759277.1 hypothetical protein [Bacteroidaceae bacterium]
MNLPFRLTIKRHHEMQRVHLCHTETKYWYQIANDIHKMVDAYIDVYKSIAPQKQSDL